MSAKHLAVLGLVTVLIVVSARLWLREGASLEKHLVPARSSASVPREPDGRLVGGEGDGRAIALSAVDVVWAPADEPRQFERRFMFECAGGDQFFVRVGEGYALLLAPASLTGHWVRLAPADSAWRGRYAGEEISFRNDEGIGSLEIGSKGYAGCAVTPDRASLAEALDGVHFQGFGHDPPWTFEIDEQNFTLTIDRGARQLQFPFRAPIDSGARITFRSVSGTQELIATIDRVPCYDARSGETFENTVAVAFDDAWFYGCGRFVRYR